MAIEESNDLSTLSIDELIDNIKVYEVVLEKDFKISKSKKGKYKSLALKAKKESSNEETSTSGSKEEEYAITISDFKKFFRRRGNVQTLQVQVEELKSVNESLNLSVEELFKARALVEATLKERDEMVYAQYEKDCALKEIESLKVEVKSFQTKNKVLKSGESELSEKIDQMMSQDPELLEKLHISNQEMKQQIIIFEEDKRIFLAKNEFIEKVTSLMQKEYNDLLASNDILKQRLETKFKFLKHDTSLEKMFEMIKKEYESNVSKISITCSTFETKNLELVKKMRDKVKCFYEEKKVFETKVLKLEKVLAQRVKDFDDAKTELSRRTNKFEAYFANLEKQNALLKSLLASQNYTSLQKENNDLRTSYNVLKEKHETSCEKL
ncbi:hypothetical protein Tco_0783543 [Tanacetum coccineum]